jgi:transposase
MDIHKNARLTLYSREQLAKRVLFDQVTLNSAAAEFKVSAKTAAKWVRRYRQGGPSGLHDRSSRPLHLRQPTPVEIVGRVEVLRRQRWAGFRIAEQTGLSRSTVSRILQRLGINRIRDLDPKPMVQRYEHAAPGDLLHLDIKKLVRIARPSHRVTGDRRDTVRGIGCEAVHVAIDDYSRIAFPAIYPDENKESVEAFLHKALEYYARLGIHFKALLTDNGSAYRSYYFAGVCRQLASLD